MVDPLGTNRSAPMSVSQLTQRIKNFLEHNFRCVWMVGQVSNFTCAKSGHWYFSLKDDSAQIRVNMWRSMTKRVTGEVCDGMEVLVFGNLNVYPPRGEYALIAERIEERGLGRLRIEFERLKNRLKEEGLFDQEFKKPIPFLPRKVGIVTSPSGAALRDILRVIRNRFPNLHLLIYPAAVQGDGAAAEIADGIDYLDRFGRCDVLIVGRGGGSEEDLWAFNEETVARAIFRAQTPIISAVGHEIDVTISDFVADLRAATPSNAAELVVRTVDEYTNLVGIQRKALDHRTQSIVLRAAARVQRAETHPALLAVPSRINDAQRFLADMDHHMHRRVEDILKKRQIRVLKMQQFISLDTLQMRFSALTDRCQRATTTLQEKMGQVSAASKDRLTQLTRRLEDLAPAKILARGYSVVFNRKKQVIQSPQQVRFGEIVEILTTGGNFHSRVIENPNENRQEGLFHQVEEGQ